LGVGGVWRDESGDEKQGGKEVTHESRGEVGQTAFNIADAQPAIVTADPH
jgi:hypothetical protein